MDIYKLANFFVFGVFMTSSSVQVHEISILSVQASDIQVLSHSQFYYGDG